MKAIKSAQYGIKVIKANRVIFLPVLIVAIVAAYLVAVAKSTLVLAALGGAALAFVVVGGWKTGSTWYGGLFGVGIGVAVGVPLILFPNHHIAVLYQMMVSGLWVVAGISLVLLILSNSISRYLNNGI